MNFVMYMIFLFVWFNSLFVFIYLSPPLLETSNEFAAYSIVIFGILTIFCMCVSASQLGEDPEEGLSGIVETIILTAHLMTISVVYHDVTHIDVDVTANLIYSILMKCAMWGIGVLLTLALFDCSHLTKKYVRAPRERRQYEINYVNNGAAPASVYESNYKYGNFWDCHLCKQPFDNNNAVHLQSQCILKCGHRFHSHCIRARELKQFNESYNYSRNPRKTCEECGAYYDHTEKWQYIPINKAYFNEIRNETALRVLPDVIENIIIDFI